MQSAEWDAWRRMIRRCYDPTDKDWKNYGGRGITVCQEWRASFQTFLRDVGKKPAPDRLIWLGRLEVNGNYEPANVAWVKHRRQISNRRYCHKTPDGVTIQEEARLKGLPPMTFRRRILVQHLDVSRAAQRGRLPYRRDSKHVTCNGKTLSVPEWAKLLGVRLRTLRERLRRGTPPEQALRPGDLRKQSGQL